MSTKRIVKREHIQRQENERQVSEQLQEEDLVFQNDLSKESLLV